MTIDSTASVTDVPAPVTVRTVGGRAHAFFWTVLGTAAAVSITGNATQAILHSNALPALSAAVAVVPPLALLAAVHGVTVLLCAHASARATHLVATAMTVVIAAGAFWLSFTALRSLAVMAGVPHGEAWLWPLIIEGSMAQSTIALLALAHSRTPRGRGAHTGTTPSTEPSATHTVTARAHAVSAAPVRASTSVHTPASDPEAQHDEFTAFARMLCARDPVRRRDPTVVAQVLIHHHIDGWTRTRIAKELNKNRSTISRILRDAAEYTNAVDLLRTVATDAEPITEQVLAPAPTTDAGEAAPTPGARR
ncbi:DUF2637 domain-containing protein [Nocardia brevicatena]|uniref:DUF2637 domain-containing protein n=1 Tax=Nocardia brevicatena TaxID=37327 RepID=UPI0003196F3A|nr:DUF2637 domain-containing protein [Nocardia brevicatena]